MANVEPIDRDRHASERGADATGPRVIADKLFVNQLNYTREVIHFLIRRQVDLSKQVEDLDALAALGTVRYSRSGQAASRDDCRNLYQISHTFISQLTNANLATSFAVWRTRGIYGLLPLAFFFGALVALSLIVFNPTIMWLGKDLTRWDIISLYIAILLWTCSLGGLGVSAFFGTSLLSQMAADNATDAAKWKERITDENYLRTRLALGILFAFVIGLPFGFASLSQAYHGITTSTISTEEYSTVIIKILAPFLFGFSTTLVLAILERVIDGIRTIFGIQGNRS
jgi:hypothetical protein